MLSDCKQWPMLVDNAVRLHQSNSNKKIVLCLHGLLAALCIYHLALCVQQYRALQFFTADVGQFDIMLYNSLHGSFFFSPVHHTNHLTKHFTPLLVLLIPLRGIFQHVLFLPILEVLSIFAGAWGIAKLWSGIIFRGKGTGAFTPLGMVLGLLYVCNPLTGSILLSNHIESFAIGLGIWALVAWSFDCRKSFWVLFVLTVFTKEDIALYWFVFGCWLAVLAVHWNEKMAANSE